MSEDLAQYHAIGKAIEQYVRPSTFPLAVRVVRTETESLRGFRRPSTDLKLPSSTGTAAAALGLAGIRALGEPAATGDAGAGVPPRGRRGRTGTGWGR